jgi:hypothetical protein
MRCKLLSLRYSSYAAVVEHSLSLTTKVHSYSYIYMYIHIDTSTCVMTIVYCRNATTPCISKSSLLHFELNIPTLDDVTAAPPSSSKVRSFLSRSRFVGWNTWSEEVWVWSMCIPWAVTRKLLKADVAATTPSTCAHIYNKRCSLLVRCCFDDTQPRAVYFSSKVLVSKCVITWIITWNDVWTTPMPSTDLIRLVRRRGITLLSITRCPWLEYAITVWAANWLWNTYDYGRQAMALANSYMYHKRIPSPTLLTAA